MLGDDILLQWLHWVSDGLVATDAVFISAASCISAEALCEGSSEVMAV